MKGYSVYVNPEYGLGERGIIKFFDDVEAIRHHLRAILKDAGETYAYFGLSETAGHSGSLAEFEGVFFNQSPDDGRRFPIYYEGELDPMTPNLTIWHRDNKKHVLNASGLESIADEDNFYPIYTPLMYVYRCRMKYEFQTGFHEATYDLNFVSLDAAIRYFIILIVSNTSHLTSNDITVGNIDYRHTGTINLYAKPKDGSGPITYQIKFDQIQFNIAGTDVKGRVYDEHGYRCTVRPVGAYLEFDNPAKQVASDDRLNPYTFFWAYIEKEEDNGIADAAPAFTSVDAVQDYYMKIVKELHPSEEEIQVNDEVCGTDQIPIAIIFLNKEHKILERVKIVKKKFISPDTYQFIHVIKPGCKVVLAKTYDKVWHMPGIYNRSDIIGDYSGEMYQIGFTVDYGIGMYMDDPEFYFTSRKAAIKYIRMYLAYKNETAMERFSPYVALDDARIKDLYNGKMYDVHIEMVKKGKFVIDENGKVHSVIDKEPIPAADPKQFNFVDDGRAIELLFNKKSIPAERIHHDRLDDRRIVFRTIAKCIQSSNESAFRPEFDYFEFRSLEEMHMLIRNRLQRVYQMRNLGEIDVEIEDNVAVYSVKVVDNYDTYNFRLDLRVPYNLMYDPIV